MTPDEARRAVQEAYWEEASVQWARDWDAVLLGFVLGILSTVVLLDIW